MALDAMKSYDPSRANLRTHLLAQLQGLHRYAARSESPVRIPEGTALDLNRLRLARERLRDDLNREPSDVELADETGLSLKRLGRLRQLPGPAVVEGQVSKQDQMGAGMWLPPVKSSPVANDLMDSWRSVVYHDSEPSDQVIMQHTFGMFGHPVLSNLQIAKKVKLSPGAVSQRRLKIQKKLDLAEDLGLFGHM
jgi:DNA-directed RNA polymerase specialized sigma subunit